MRKTLKGNVSYDFVTIVTLGGELDGYRVTWSHHLTLSNGERGIFFLKPTLRPEQSLDSFPTNFFDVYGSMQGFYHLEDDENGHGIVAYSYQKFWKNPTDLYQYIQERTKQQITIQTNWSEEKWKLMLNENYQEETGICYVIGNVSINTFNQEISFDLFVKGLYKDYNLIRGGIVFTYNPDFFGGSLAQNNRMSVVVNSEISNSYAATITDIASNKLELSIDKNTSTLTDYFKIDDQERLLAHINVKIANPTLDPDFEVEEELSKSINQWYSVKESTSYSFDEFCFSGTVSKGLACPEINTISVNRGGGGVGDVIYPGVTNTITITGENFSTPPAGEIKPSNRRVEFDAIEDVGKISALVTDYISWSDNEIVLRIPSIGHQGDDDNFNNIDLNRTVGTGKVKVKTESLDICFNNTKDFYVQFAEGNVLVEDEEETWPINLSDQYDGGFAIIFNSDFRTISGGQEAFVRALNTWRCATLVNYFIVNQPVANNSVIGYSNGAFSNVAATARAVTQLSSAPPTCAQESVGKLQIFQLYFRKDKADGTPIVWYTGIPENNNAVNWDDKLDLETIALHEIGHAMNLRHTNNDHNVMYPTVTEFRRNLTDDDELGGHQITWQSSTFDNCTIEEMELLDILEECKITLSTNTPFALLRYRDIPQSD